MRTPVLFTGALSLALCALAGAQDCPVSKAKAKTVSKTECPATCDEAKAKTVAVAKTCTDEAKAQTVAKSEACSASACDGAQPVAVVVTKAAPVALVGDDEKACDVVVKNSATCSDAPTAVASIKLDTPNQLARVFAQDVELDDVTNLVVLNDVVQLQDFDIESVDLKDALKNIEIELSQLEALEGINLDLSKLHQLENIQVDLSDLQELGVDLHALGENSIVVGHAVGQDGPVFETLQSLGYAGDDADERGYLGIYMALGDDGMVVNDVMAGGPAEKMGLEQGDLIVQINDRKLSGDDMEFLTDLEAGDKVTVIAVRGDKKIKAKGKLQTLASIEGANEEIEEIVEFEDEPQPRLGQFRVEGPGGNFRLRRAEGDEAHGELRLRINGKDVEVGDLQGLRFGNTGELHVEVEAEDIRHGGHGGEIEVQLDVPDADEWQELRTRVKERVHEHQGGQGRAIFQGKDGEHFVVELDGNVNAWLGTGGDDGHGHDHDEHHAHGDGHGHDNDNAHSHDHDGDGGQHVERRIRFRSDDGDEEEIVIHGGGGNVWFGASDDHGDDGGKKVEHRFRVHSGDGEVHDLLLPGADGQQRVRVLRGDGGGNWTFKSDDDEDVKVEKRVRLKLDDDAASDFFVRGEGKGTQRRIRVERGSDGPGGLFIHQGGDHDVDVEVRGKAIIVDGNGKQRVIEFGGDDDNSKLHQHLLQGLGKGGDLKVRSRAMFMGEDGELHELDFGGGDNGKLHKHLMKLHGEHKGGDNEKLHEHLMKLHGAHGDGGADVLHGIVTELHGREGGGHEGLHQILIQGADGKTGTWMTPDVDHDVLMWDTRTDAAPRRRAEVRRGRVMELRDDADDDDDLEERLDDLQDEIKALRREIRELKGLLRRR